MRAASVQHPHCVLNTLFSRHPRAVLNTFPRNSEARRNPQPQTLNPKQASTRACPVCARANQHPRTILSLDCPNTINRYR